MSSLAMAVLHSPGCDGVVVGGVIGQFFLQWGVKVLAMKGRFMRSECCAAASDIIYQTCYNNTKFSTAALLTLKNAMQACGVRRSRLMQILKN